MHKTNFFSDKTMTHHVHLHLIAPPITFQVDEEPVTLLLVCWGCSSAMATSGRWLSRRSSATRSQCYTSSLLNSIPQTDQDPWHKRPVRGVKGSAAPIQSEWEKHWIQSGRWPSAWILAMVGTYHYQRSYKATASGKRPRSRPVLQIHFLPSSVTRLRPTHKIIHLKLVDVQLTLAATGLFDLWSRASE